jgi:hypothetical protein
MKLMTLGFVGVAWQLSASGTNLLSVPLRIIRTIRCEHHAHVIGASGNKFLCGARGATKASYLAFD